MTGTILTIFVLMVFVFITTKQVNKHSIRKNKGIIAFSCLVMMLSFLLFLDITLGMATEFLNNIFGNLTRMVVR